MTDSKVLAMLDDLDFEVQVSGRKSSEGDGRTAADIERELAHQDPEELDGAQ